MFSMRVGLFGVKRAGRLLVVFPLCACLICTRLSSSHIAILMFGCDMCQACWEVLLRTGH